MSLWNPFRSTFRNLPIAGRRLFPPVTRPSVFETDFFPYNIWDETDREMERMNRAMDHFFDRHFDRFQVTTFFQTFIFDSKYKKIRRLILDSRSYFRFETMQQSCRLMKRVQCITKLMSLVSNPKN